MINEKNLLFTVLKVGKFKVKKLAGSFLVRALCFIDGIFLLPPHMVE
jgi:hypothetical protein